MSELNIPNEAAQEVKDLLGGLVKRFGPGVIKTIANEVNQLRMTPEDLKEPILNPKNKKFTAFPIKYPTIWKLYKAQEACSWKAEEIDFSQDYEDFLTLSSDEQFFVEMILAFFAASDGIVNFNLSERFTRDIQITEAEFAYQFQMMMENVHSHTYSAMLDNIVRDVKKKEKLFNAITTVPAVKLMADWAFKWIDSEKSFAHRLIAFAIVELVFFSGAFAAIFWIKKYRSKGKMFMNGLVSSNKLIARDEGLHGMFACELYKLLETKLSAEVVYEMVTEGVDIAKNFMTVSLPVDLIGMNKQMMCDYEEYIGDRLINMLGYKKLFNTKNPFSFMDTIGLDDKTNFFESRPTEYQDAFVMNTSSKQSDIDFNKEDIDDLDF